MYTRKDLKKAFDAGSALQFAEDCKSEGFSDFVDVTEEYKSFREWFNLKYNKDGKS
jgi:hypothetical protein